MLNIIAILLIIICSPVILVAGLVILALILIMPITLLIGILNCVIDITINNKKD